MVGCDVMDTPTVDIVDDGEKPLKDKIFKIGSTLELRCIVNQVGPTMDSGQHVSWYHGSRLLNNDTFRGGISVKSWVQKESGFSKLSKLYVANVNSNDSGWYTCSMGRFGNATVYVSIYVHGETPAAMQHGDGSKLSSSVFSSLTFLLTTQAACCILH
ncbi:Leucine-rich repeats and immunoglobulin-like domains protein 1 [Folsomia candida]|uniref:Leucine-rich repeats and immunoglobulin-like domains protein 1 n=1 Tax=Folsomia candida TaxID=158441 RepID=A0A226E5V5_FOLCA|nr:Leucine-rich repeats and immunoglobulin-like domains protein 1 [Folsomia candida]